MTISVHEYTNRLTQQMYPILPFILTETDEYVEKRPFTIVLYRVSLSQYYPSRDSPEGMNHEYVDI